MEGSSRNGWVMKRDEQRSHGSSSSSASYSEEERQLELRLGPPGDHTTKNNFRERDHDSSLLSLGYFSSSPASITPNNNNNNNNGGGQRPINNGTTHWSYHHHHHLHQFPSSTNIHQSMPVIAKESSSSQPCSTKIAELQNAEKKQFSPSPAPNTAVPNNTSQKRTAPAPVVGWPPIRSFRKNLASNTTYSKSGALESQNVGPSKVMEKPAPPPPQPVENQAKGLFVKINMDGVPIGRKVDLKAYDSYEKLSSAVDQLFRALLAAQRDSSVGGIRNKQEEEKPITGLLDGSGEYTLVYEDNEGDRMLVGDVPWHMFVSTVKRLRVLKSSELSVMNLGNKQGKIST